MKPLSPEELLELWERGARRNPLDQGLLALSAALPDVRPDAIADWPLGRLNRALLELHRSSFGSRMQAWSECAGCGEKMEFEVDTQALLDAVESQSQTNEPIEVNGLRFRLPSIRDLAQAVQESDPDQGALRILERCCIGEAPDEWTSQERNAIEEKLAAADPIAEPRLSLVCPGCGETQDKSLELSAFVWSELQALAKRLMRDIHVLASAYGWSEREILSLSSHRRSMYVEMVNA